MIAVPPLRRPPLGRVRDAALTRVEYLRRAGRGSVDGRVVAIVGMHRSGTSAVAGTLQEAGLYLGSVLRKHDSNARGTREHLGIVELHDAIFAHSGGSWRDPPGSFGWTDEHRDERDRVISRFAAAELWGFKDPRTILLLDFWREALGDSLSLVGVFREPGAVVASLLERDGGSSEEWLSLWTHYNAQLLREHEDHRFPLVEFTADTAEFHAQLLPALRALGLRESTGRGFFEASLATSDGAVSPRDAHAVDLYARLRAAQA